MLGTTPPHEPAPGPAQVAGKFFEEVWSDGEPDPQWTEELQTQLTETMRTLSVEPSSLKVECATQLCRVDITLKEQSEGARLMGATTGTGGKFTVTNSETIDGAFHATAYVARVGDSLPKSPTDNPPTDHGGSEPARAVY
jgi:hypothetical protein